MALHVRRAPTNIGHPQTLGIRKAHPQGARTNIGHAQGKSKDGTQSELGQQQSQVVAFLVLLCIQRLKNSEYTRLSERKHS